MGFEQLCLTPSLLPLSILTQSIHDSRRFILLGLRTEREFELPLEAKVWYCEGERQEHKQLDWRLCHICKPIYSCLTSFHTT